MSGLADWTEAVKDAFGIAHDVDQTLVLDMARDVAHGVARPAAPLTAYLMGLAVGAGADPRQVAARLSAMAATWRTDTRTDAPDNSGTSGT